MHPPDDAPRGSLARSRGAHLVANSAKPSMPNPSAGAADSAGIGPSRPPSDLETHRERGWVPWLRRGGSGGLNVFNKIRELVHRRTDAQTLWLDRALRMRSEWVARLGIDNRRTHCVQSEVNAPLSAQQLCKHLTVCTWCKTRNPRPGPSKKGAICGPSKTGLLLEPKGFVWVWVCVSLAHP